MLLAVALPAAPAKAFRYGAGIRISSFGIPNALLDLALYEHPQLSGNAYSFEIHSYGKKARAPFSAAFTAWNTAAFPGEGYFRVEQFDNRLFGSGEVTQVNFTATILMHIFPSSPVHPYIGGGIGIGRMSILAEGTYQDELGTTIRDSFEKKAVRAGRPYPGGHHGQYQ